MPRGYFDLDSILLEDERVPCIFVREAPQAGGLDPSQGKEDFEVGDEVELPLWMARTLGQKAMGVVRVEPPKCYGEKALARLEAGAHVVNLKSWSVYYYKFGAAYLSYRNDEDSQHLKDILIKVLTGERLKKLVYESMNCDVEDAGNLSKEMACTEKIVFFAGHEGAESYRKWKTREDYTIKPSQLAPRAKRKRDQSS